MRPGFLFQKPDIALVGFPENIEHIADQRHRAERVINRQIGQHFQQRRVRYTDPVRPADHPQTDHQPGCVAQHRHQPDQRIEAERDAGECVNFGILTKSTVGQEPCATCHGSQGITDDSEMPNLAGQSLSYLVYQYRLFREQSLPDSQRTKTKTDYNRVHPIMGSISANITENVITILAYYSKLPCRAQ